MRSKTLKCAKASKEDEEKYTAMFEGIQLLVNILVHDLLSFLRAEANDMGADCEDSFMKISVLEMIKFRILEKTRGVIMQVIVQLVELFCMPNVISTGLLYKEFVDLICEVMV